MEQKLNELMTELCKTHQEMDEKLATSIAKVKQEVTSAQERMAQDFSHKLTKSTYQFRKKGNKMQFLLNVGVEESIASAKKQLEKMALTDEAQKASLKKAAEHLDKNNSVLKMRQKHIKVVNRSEYGWNTVHYQSDPLTLDSGMKKSSKELRKMQKGF